MHAIKVLIVEDDPMVAEINKSFTEMINSFCVIGIARNGQDALSMCRAKRPDLVILDIYMPGIDGLDVLAALRQANTMIDVIMITAANDSATISKAMRLGIAGYIIKPFKFERYRAVLDAYRDFNRKVKKSGQLEQADIDKVFAVRIDPAASELPKNFHIQTLNSILDFLAASETPPSAEEVALEIGISQLPPAAIWNTS